jgi:hypothetical protein
LTIPTDLLAVSVFYNLKINIIFNMAVDADRFSILKINKGYPAKELHKKDKFKI